MDPFSPIMGQLLRLLSKPAVSALTHPFRAWRLRHGVRKALRTALSSALSSESGWSVDAVEQHMSDSEAASAVADTASWFLSGMQEEGGPRKPLPESLALALHLLRSLDDHGVTLGPVIPVDRFGLVHALAVETATRLFHLGNRLAVRAPQTPDPPTEPPLSPAQAWQRLLELDASTRGDIATVMRVPAGQRTAEAPEHVRLDHHGMYIPRRLERRGHGSGTQIVDEDAVVPAPLTATCVVADSGTGKSCLLWRVRASLPDAVLIPAPGLLESADEHFRPALGTALTLQRELGQRPTVLLDSVEEVLSDKDGAAVVDAFAELCAVHEVPLVVACRPEAFARVEKTASGHGLTVERFDLLPYSLREGEVERALRTFVRVLVPAPERHDALVAVLLEGVALGLPVRDICESPLRMRLMFETGALPLDRPTPEELRSELREIDTLALLERDYVHRVVRDQRRGVPLPAEREGSSARARDMSRSAQDAAVFLLSRGRSRVPVSDSLAPLRALRRLRPRGRMDVEEELAALTGRNVLRRSLTSRGLHHGSLEFVHQIQFDYIAAQALLVDERGISAVLDRLLAHRGEFFLANVASMALAAAPVRGRALREAALEGIERLLRSDDDMLRRYGVRCYAQCRSLSSSARGRLWGLLKDMPADNAVEYVKWLPTVAHDDTSVRFDELTDLWRRWDRPDFRLRVLVAVHRLASRARTDAIVFVRRAGALEWLRGQKPDDKRDATLANLLEALLPPAGSVSEEDPHVPLDELPEDSYILRQFELSLVHLVENTARLTTVADVAGLAAWVPLPAAADSAVSRLDRHLRTAAAALRVRGEKYRAELSLALGRVRVRRWALEHGTDGGLSQRAEQELTALLRACPVSQRESDRANERALGFVEEHKRTGSLRPARSLNADEFITLFAVAEVHRRTPLRMDRVLDLVEECPRHTAAQYTVTSLVRPVAAEQLPDPVGRRIALSRLRSWLAEGSPRLREFAFTVLMPHDFTPPHILKLVGECLGAGEASTLDPLENLDAEEFLAPESGLCPMTVPIALAGSSRAAEAMASWSADREAPARTDRADQILGRQCQRFFATDPRARDWLLRRWRNAPGVEGALWLAESAGDRLDEGMCALGSEALGEHDRVRLTAALVAACERRHNPNATAIFSVWTTLLQAQVVGPPSAEQAVQTLELCAARKLGSLSALLLTALGPTDRTGQRPAQAWSEKDFHTVEPLLRERADELHRSLTEKGSRFRHETGSALVQVRHLLLTGLCLYPRERVLEEVHTLLTEPPTSRDNAAPVASLLRFLAGSEEARAHVGVTLDDLTDFLLRVGRSDEFTTSRQARNTAMQLRPGVYALVRALDREKRLALLAECTDCAVGMVQSILRATADISPKDVQALLNGQVPARGDGTQPVLAPEARRVAHQMVSSRARRVDSQRPWHELLSDLVPLWWSTD